MSKRKICVVTGTRAEYGLLYWLMREISADDDLQLQIIVTGAHLSHEFGLTYKLIESDGFAIDAKVEMLLSSDTPVGIIKSMGLELTGMADVLDRLKPDILVVLGDRYEILAPVQAALIFNIPVAHIHGGELTYGVVDDAIRHSITKMSHLHFVAADEYKNRVIQLGEQPDRVFKFGAIGLDNIANLKLLSKKELCESISFDLTDKYFLVTYHPVTALSDGADSHIGNLLAALDEYHDYKLLITKPNADAGGRAIVCALEAYADKNPSRVSLHASLGQMRYLSAVKYAAAVVGNSSSAIIEVPVFKVPTVNIGTRQDGRLMANSVVCCRQDKKSIDEALKLALSEDFQNKLSLIKTHYGSGETSKMIKEKLKEIDLKGILSKKFYDLR